MTMGLMLPFSPSVMVCVVKGMTKLAMNTLQARPIMPISFFALWLVLNPAVVERDDKHSEEEVPSLYLIRGNRRADLSLGGGSSRSSSSPFNSTMKIPRLQCDGLVSG